MQNPTPSNHSTHKQKNPIPTIAEEQKSSEIFPPPSAASSSSRISDQVDTRWCLLTKGRFTIPLSFYGRRVPAAGEKRAHFQTSRQTPNLLLFRFAGRRWRDETLAVDGESFWGPHAGSVLIFDPVLFARFVGFDGVRAWAVLFEDACLRLLKMCANAWCGWYVFLF